MTKVLISAFQCENNGISESYVGYNWVKQISKFSSVKLLTSGNPEFDGDVEVIRPSDTWKPRYNYFRKLNSAVKFDYLYFNFQSAKRYKHLVSEVDVVHHVVPIAPRYPCSLGVRSDNFILGPIGGGLRVPERFRKEVESSEEAYFSLRNIDNLRLKYDKTLRNTYKSASKILIVGEYMREILPPEFHHKTELMLETGIEPDDYKPCTRNIEKKIRLLYVGRVVPYKGLKYLLMALAKLPVNIRDSIELDVIGNKDVSEYEKECRTIVAVSGLSEIVSFRGYLPKAETIPYYERANLLCFLTLAETSGNVLLESMAMGLPVLSVNYGGPALILDAESGILLDACSPEGFVDSISETIVNIVRDPQRLSVMGVNARKRVVEEFSWDAKGKKMQEVYDEVLS